MISPTPTNLSSNLGGFKYHSGKSLFVTGLGFEPAQPITKINVLNDNRKILFMTSSKIDLYKHTILLNITSFKNFCSKRKYQIVEKLIYNVHFHYLNSEP